MQQIISDTLNGTLSISDQFSITAATSSSEATPIFSKPGEEYTISFVDIMDVNKLTTFSYDTLGSTDTRFLTTTYRLSRNSTSWSDFQELKSDIDNFPPFDPKDPLYVDVKWTRGGSSTIGIIRLLEYKLSGLLEVNIETGDVPIKLKAGESTILKAPYIYKVFKVDDIEIISSSVLTDVNIKYRFSQDSSRTFSGWEPFTKENITSLRINPIRFFQVEYSIENNSTSNITIQDVNLIGDFQNVSKDYFKTNLYGIRECCQSNVSGYYDTNGTFIPNTSSTGVSNSGGQCDTTNALYGLTSEDKSQLYNPYQQNTAINLLNKLSTDAQQIFGHRVIYFVTDADKQGQDHTLHEYQLYNVVCDGNIKVSIEGNNFPDSQIMMNQFDLNLFETMEAHITKQQFKEIFGPQRRPSKEDFLYFCDLNRMYQVEHAQQFRNFNNSAIYYKLILKKYTQKANVKAGTPEIKNKLAELTKNTTIEELFGVEIKQDKDAVANKEQYTTLTKDPIRMDYFAQIDKELIENSSNIISKSNYDLSTIDFGSVAVRYKNMDTYIKKGDNIGYMTWFNIHNYVVDDVYNLFNLYDSINDLGWKANLINDNLIVNISGSTYSYNITGDTIPNTIGLEEDTWYCYLLNIDQRLRTITQYIYKRNVDDEDDAQNLQNTLLQLVYENTQDMTPVEFQLEGVFAEIFASDMKMTNIRLFTDIIPKEEHNKMLNQAIIGEASKYLVFADNANTRLSLPNFPLGNE
jgi:hypothetical protein